MTSPLAAGTYCINPMTNNPHPGVVVADSCCGLRIKNDDGDPHVATDLELDTRFSSQPGGPGAATAWFAGRRLAPAAERHPSRRLAAGPAPSSLGVPSSTPRPGRAARIAAAVGWLDGSATGRRGARLRGSLFSRSAYSGQPFPYVYERASSCRRTCSGATAAGGTCRAPGRLPRAASGQRVRSPHAARAPRGGFSRAALDLGDDEQFHSETRHHAPMGQVPAGPAWLPDRPNPERLMEPAVNDLMVSPVTARATAVRPVHRRIGAAVLVLLYARSGTRCYTTWATCPPGAVPPPVQPGYVLADTYLDARGMYVPTAEVVTAPNNPPRYQGQP